MNSHSSTDEFMSHHASPNTIVIHGDPYGKAAPKARVMGKGKAARAQVYSAASDKVYAKRIVAALAEVHWTAIADKRAEIWVEITAHFKRSGSHLLTDGSSLSAKGREFIGPTKKPDTDNISKIILDTFTHAGVWIDDAQVTRNVQEKVWSDKACVVVEWGLRREER